MKSSRLLSPVGRILLALVLVTALSLLPSGAAAGPLEQAFSAPGAPTSTGLVAGWWAMVLDFFGAEPSENEAPADLFRSKCGVIPDPSGICKNGQSSTPAPALRTELEHRFDS